MVKSDKEADVSSSTSSKSNRLETFLALLPFIQKVLTLLVIIGIVTAFYRPITTKLLASVTKMEMFGLTFEFNSVTSTELKKLFESQAPTANFEQAFQSVSARLRHVGAMSVGSKILWIDDNHPKQNIQERELAREMGLFVDMVSSEKEADELLDLTKELGLREHDVIISDNTRGQNHTAGQEYFGRLAQRNLKAKLILYTGKVDKSAATPNYVFGVTDRFDELLHLILDALERRDDIGSGLGLVPPIPPVERGS